MQHPTDLQYQQLRMALDLMKTALELLDEVGETTAAAHLQHAISHAQQAAGRPVSFRPQSGDS